MASRGGRVFLVMGLALAVPAHAKVALARITISGGGLSEPVTVTDRETLDLADPWKGAFVDWDVASVSPPQGIQVYEVTLLAPLRTPEIGPIYHFRYAKGKVGEPGYVYFPGKEEPWYRENVTVIYRKGQEGRWHAATGAWGERVRQALGGREALHARRT